MKGTPHFPQGNCFMLAKYLKQNFQRQILYKKTHTLTYACICIYVFLIPDCLCLPLGIFPRDLISLWSARTIVKLISGQTQEGLFNCFCLCEDRSFVDFWINSYALLPCYLFGVWGLFSITLVIMGHSWNAACLENSYHGLLTSTSWEHFSNGWFTL